jgi:hypothetical protein
MMKDGPKGNDSPGTLELAPSQNRQNPILNQFNRNLALNQLIADGSYSFFGAYRGISSPQI